MKVGGIEPLQLQKIQEQTQKPLVQESQRQEPRQKGQQKVPEKEVRLEEWERSYMEELEEAVKKVNITAETFNVSLRFCLHEESERVMVQVINLETNEVIKEIPPEKVLNVVAQIQNIIGLFIDTRR